MHCRICIAIWLFVNSALIKLMLFIFRSDPLIHLNYAIFLYNRDKMAAAADQFRLYTSAVRALNTPTLDPDVRHSYICMCVYWVLHSHLIMLLDFFFFLYLSLFSFSSAQPPYQEEKKGGGGANLNSRSVKEYQNYRSHLVKWLTLKNSEPY